MTKRVTTESVLKDMRRKHERERRVSDAIHEQGLELVQRMCDAGLVDDVEPTPGVVVSESVWSCAACGRESRAIEDELQPCPCGSYVWLIR